MPPLGTVARCVVGLALSAGLVAGLARADEGAERRVRHALAPRVIDGVAERAWPARPLLDEARAAVGAEVVWEREGGTRGAGATVCVVDTGIDLTHEDFRDPSGGTRVRWLFDLGRAPRGVHPALEGGAGAVWSREEIDALLSLGGVLPEDRQGHGTAVASIAAGDGTGRGAAEPGAHAGLAPEAELVVVSAYSAEGRGFTQDDVVRGARFCADRRVGDPSRTVVLLALGGHDGAHDGTSAYERALAALVTEGVAVVAAAGNDGERSVHARGRVVRDQAVAFSLRSPGTERDDAVIAVVVRGAREVRAQLPLAAQSAWVHAGEQRDDGSLLVDATDPGAIYVVARGRSLAGDLRIEARGPTDSSGLVDAWLVEDSLGEVLFSPRFVGETAAEGHEVTIPATADRVISVGASVSREFLAGEGGAVGLTASADESGRASYSARGPRIDGAPLPTLIAPGGWMIVALSSALDPDAVDAPFSRARYEQLRRGEDRIAFAGTSMAAAVVAGVIALGRASDASARDERSVVAASAAPAAASARVPFDPRVGAGILDAPGYVSVRTGIDVEIGPLEVGCTRSRAAPAPTDVQVVVRARGGASARVRTRAGEGAFSGTRTMIDGFVSVPVVVPPAALGEVLVIEAEVDGVLVRACELEISEPLGASVRLGAGCGIAPRAGGVGVGVLAGLALTALCRRSRAARRPGR